MFHTSHSRPTLAQQRRTWDVVIDNSATVPRRIREAAVVLQDATDLYVYVSSSGVYYPYLVAGFDELNEIARVCVGVTRVPDLAAGKETRVLEAWHALAE